MIRKEFFKTGVLIALLGGAAGGCRSVAQDNPSAAIWTTPRPPSEVFETALDVLQGMHFQIAKADRDAGFIQSHPLSGAQWFELWRRDNSSFQAFAEANLHSLRRTATIRISNRDGQAHMDCQVACERLSVPSRHVNSSSQLYRILTDSDPMLQRLEYTEQQQQAMNWIDLGNDPALQDRILGTIKRQLPPL